jgi:hypothetical protein
MKPKKWTSKGISLAQITTEDKCQTKNAQNIQEDQIKQP